MKNLKTVVLSEASPYHHPCSPSGAAFQAGDKATIFQTDDGGYGYCFHGVGDNGAAYEADDVTGFTSEAEAEKAARDMYAELKED